MQMGTPQENFFILNQNSLLPSVSSLCCKYSEEISSARELQTEIISKALAEIDVFCDSLSWLAEIHSFARKWTKDAVNQWKRAQAYTIEVTHCIALLEPSNK